MNARPRANDGAPSTAIVTGASRGIGLAIAARFVGDGMRVVMLARGFEALSRQAKSLGTAAVPLRCDVAVPGDVASAVTSALETLGGAPDVLVNNAGLFHLASLEEETAERFAETLAANLAGPFHLTSAVLPAMRARGRGHVVTIGSIADREIFPGNSAYAASKFGGRAVHEVMRAELKGSGVRATLVSPGPVDTDIWREIDPDNRAGFTPRRAMLQPDAVADAVQWAVRRAPDINVDEIRLSRS